MGDQSTLPIASDKSQRVNWLEQQNTVSIKVEFGSKVAVARIGRGVDVLVSGRTSKVPDRIRVMNKLPRIALFASVALVTISSTASADSMTIGGVNSSCMTCQGSKYRL